MIVTALADDGPDGDQARERLRGERLAAPHLLDLEVTSAWRRLVAAGELDERRARQALADLQGLRLDRVPHGILLNRCWELRTNVSVYDAAYLALAELLEITFVTADGKLAKAQRSRCRIEVLG